MKKYIMAFDQGTTSSRCILYNRQGRAISVAQKEITQIYPENGWVEHDPMEIWSIQVGLAQEAMYKVNCTYENIAAIGITNQRETTVVWNKTTGKPIYNAIVWQCRRTAQYCDQLKAKKEYYDMIKEKTGLFIDAYFSGSKLKWILDNVPDARSEAEAGNLLFGTIETWLIWKMTGGKVHITDYSNASRTMMFNIKTLKWDDEILELLDVPLNMLPSVKSSSEIYGYTKKDLFSGEIPIAGAAGDQQASLFGLTCFGEGDCKMTYGTGGFMLMNTGNIPVISENGLITTIAWGIEDKIFYALEGSVFVAGAAVQWLRDEMGLVNSAEETETMANSVGDTGGVFFVPAFVGLGAPYWDQYARGSIQGLTRATNKNHIVRAALESMAYQTKDLADAMSDDIKKGISELKVDGGAAKNNFVMQFQADIMNSRVIRGFSVETTSLGAAYLAGLAIRYWKDTTDIVENVSIERVFQPGISVEKREKLVRNWKKAVDRTKSWIN